MVRRYPLLNFALFASAAAIFTITLLSYVSLTTLDTALLLGALTPLVVLARPSLAPIHSFWDRLAARDPDARRTI